MDGIRLRDEIVAGLRSEVAAAGSPPVCLATVLVADDRPSHLHVRAKHEQADAAGMLARGVALRGSALQAEVDDEVGALVADPSVHGIFVQLPLPEALDTERVLDLLTPDNDVDGLSAASMGRLLRGSAGHAPCTPLAVMRLLHRYGVPTSGKRVVIVGRSPLVGLPLSVLLVREGVDATLTLAHSRTPDLADVCRQADVLIATTGSAQMIGPSHVRPGAAVVDVGVSRTEAGIVGDVEFDAVQAVAGAIAPMPGGTGPVTIACLLENTLAAARLQGAFPADDGID